MLLRKVVLKKCSKFTGEHPCRSAILISPQQRKSNLLGMFERSNPGQRNNKINLRENAYTVLNSRFINMIMLTIVSYILVFWNLCGILAEVAIFFSIHFY